MKKIFIVLIMLITSLVAKPIDYRSQAPKDWDWGAYWKYVDIRDLYQWNPIIERYKELAKIKDSE